MERGKASGGRLNWLTVAMACQSMALLLASGDALAGAPPTYYDLTIEIHDEAGNPGTLSPEAGVHSYISGAQVTLEATPNAGWVFTHWYFGEETIDANPHTITMDSDTVITAVFTKRFSLSPAVIGKGTITVEPELPEYAGGARVQVTAIPEAGWTFDHWECPGDLSVDGATVSPVDVVVDQDRKGVTAVFRSAHDLEIAVLGSGSVVLTPDPDGKPANVTGGGPRVFHYGADMTVELAPTPDAGHEVACWVMVSKQNTVWIDYNPGPVFVKMEVYRSVTAMFKPQEGQTDSSTDFVVPVLGPGQVIVDYPNRPDRLTSDVLMGSVPAGETISATAVAADPDVGVFTCWEIVSGKKTTYATDETIGITTDTIATALYLEFVDPKTMYASPVSTRVLGQGSINIGEGSFVFSTYNVPGDPRSGSGTLHLFATSAPGWVFKQWWGAPVEPGARHAVLSLFGAYDVMAEFVERQGMEALDFVGDFQAFLADIQGRVELENPGIFEFDTGEVEHISGNKVLLLPNNTPDVAELALLQGVLQNTEFERSHAGGASHTLLWEYYQTNLAQATQDLASLDPHIQRLTAAYMTLGSFGHQETMPHYLREVFGVEINPDRYQLFGARFFKPRGDVDNDGKWNFEEWRNVVKACGGVVDMDTVALFVAAAMNRESDGLDEDDGLAPNEFRFEGRVIQKMQSAP